jgi:hypothetical protein
LSLLLPNFFLRSAFFTRMKKLLTLGALGLLTALGAQAQITQDGRISASEIGSTPTKYQLIGNFTNPRGFGDWGLKSAYVANDANFLYIGINGTVENNGNAFQIFFDIPGRNGAPACTPLTPAPSPTGDPTSFTALAGAFDMSIDAGISFRYNELATPIVPQVELADYTIPTPASQVLYTMTDDGTPASVGVTPPASVTGAAYRNSPDGKVTTNTDEGFEFKVALAAYGITPGTAVRIFVLMNNKDGGFASTDFIPQDPGGTGQNLGPGFDLCQDVNGNQYVDYIVGQGLGVKKLNADAISFTVAPNPVSGGAADVQFTVPGARAEQGSVIVTDLMGRTVATLASGNIAAGAQRYSLNTSGLAAGQYIVKLVLGDKVATRKVSVL